MLNAHSNAPIQTKVITFLFSSRPSTHFQVEQKKDLSSENIDNIALKTSHQTPTLNHIFDRNTLHSELTITKQLCLMICMYTVIGIYVHKVNNLMRVFRFEFVAFGL